MPFSRNLGVVRPPEEFRDSLSMLVGSHIPFRCLQIDKNTKELEISIKGNTLSILSEKKTKKLKKVNLYNPISLSAKGEQQLVLGVNNEDFEFDFEDMIERDGVLF